MQIEVVPIDSLVADSDNAKVHTPEQIADIVASIAAFHFNDPLGIVGNIIVEGEGRWLAMKEMGATEIPVVRLDHLNDAQRRAYAIAHNHLNRKTGMDPLKVKVNIEAIRVAGVDLKPIGFSTAEIRKFSGKKEIDEAADKLLAESERAEFVPFVQTDDLWILGSHRVLCGDSISANDVARAMNGKIADLVLTDPPYNVAYEGGTGMTIENDSMGDAAFRQFLFAMYQNAFAATKPGGSIYVFHADSEGYNFRGAMVDAGWMLKQCLIWMKDRLVLGRQDYHWIHEPILVGWKPGAAHTWNSDREQTSILRFDRPSRSPDHPTTKSVEMFQYLIGNSSLPGQVVFDPFGGSGTTAIAAAQSGREAHLIELSPVYCSVIVKRLADFMQIEPYVHRQGKTMTLSETIDATKVQ